MGELANNTPGATNVKAYARIVHERSVLRRLIAATNEIAQKSYSPDGSDVREILDYAEKLVFEISQGDRRRTAGLTAIQGLLAGAINRIEELYESGSTLTGISTGFSDLDDLTSGLQRSDLIVIAGRPSMGKTSLAMNIVESAVLDSKLPVAVFSMEMPGQQLAMRMLSSLGRINAHRVRTGKLTGEDWPRLTSAVGLLNEVPLFIDDTAALTPLELRSRARRLAREHSELGLIVVDYLQLMQSSESSENRAIEVANITRSLKILAKELNVPVVVLSQLNRGLEQRPNKRPIMSDLRESGAIEQDADVILFIYRDEVYNLANSKKHADILKRLRKAQRALAIKIRDVGFLPEGEIHSRSGEGAPYDMGHDEKVYPMERVMHAAEIASMKSEPAGKELAKLITDKDSAVRYWAAMGYLIRGEKAVNSGREQLRHALSDESTAVVCVAAEALGRYGKGKDQSAAIDTLMKHADVSKNSVFTSMLALNALDYVDDNAKHCASAIKALPTRGKVTPARMGNYVPNLITKTAADLGLKIQPKPKRPRKNRK